MIALVDRLRALGAAERDRILARCSAEELAALEHAWREFWARPDVRARGAAEGTGQIPPPGDWTWWASIGGRAAGKTEACAHWVHEEAMRLGHGCVFVLLGQSIDLARRDMVDGMSGLGTVAPPWAGFDFRPSVDGGALSWRSGAKGYLFGADNVDAARGPNSNRMWIDDAAAFGKHGLDVFKMLLLTFRQPSPDGSSPRGVISTTPIESDLLRWILDDGDERRRRSKIVYSRSTSDDNRANLARTFFTETLAEFAGTELEQQERFGRLERRSASKVFAGIDFDATRVDGMPDGRLLSFVVWIDPSVSSSVKSCECGIIAAGMAMSGDIYVLEDLSAVLGANEWPERALECYERWESCASEAHVGVETNRGSNQSEGLVRSAEVIRHLRAGRPGISSLVVRTVHTGLGKVQRADPLPALYRARRVHHVGRMDVLERQLRDLDDSVRPGRDRADALVYAVLDLVGIIDRVKPGAGPLIGGTSFAGARVEPFGPAPLGSVVVGAVAQVRPFQFSTPAAGARR